LKRVHAVLASLGMHAAAILLVGYSNADLDTGGLARPPVMRLQARLFTYQQAEAAAQPGAPDSGTALEQAALPQRLQDRPALPTVPTVPTLLPTPAPAPTDPAPPAPVPPAASEAVLDSAALDASPILLSTVTLEYPLSAHNREGVVTLAIVVSGSGAVEDVSVLKASPPGFFEAAALAGFRNARFSPGLLGGLGVKSRMVIEVEFMPTNRGGAVGGQR
jgi:TonB family protein